MTVEKPIPKKFLRPIPTGVNRAKNQSEFLAFTVTCSKAREKSRIQSAIGFGFASHRLKTLCEIFKPIKLCSNRKRNYFRSSFENCSAITEYKSSKLLLVFPERGKEEFPKKKKKKRNPGKVENDQLNP